MKTETNHTRLVISRIIIIFLIVLVIVVMKLTEDAGSTIDSNILLKDNWQINLCGKEYQDVSLDNFSFPCTQKGDRIEMCCELPYKYDIASIGFYSIHSRFTVTFDGKLIYTYGYEDLSEKKIIGYGTHLIKLPKEYEGKTLAISLEVTENNAFTTLECPRLCNPFTYDRSVIFKNRIPFTVNIFLVLFGLITSLVAVSMVSVNKKIFQLFYLGMFSLCVGLWTLANHNLFFVFSYDLLVKTLVEYGTLYLACLFFLLYFKNQSCAGSKFRKIIYYSLLSVYILFLIVAFGGQILNLVHFPELLFFCHILLGMVMIFVIYVIFSDIKRKKTESKVLFWGLVIMFFFCSSDVVRFYYTKYSNPSWSYDYQSRISIGILFFVISMFTDYIGRIMISLYETAEKETLEKLAFTDSMTGLSNRRRCENVFDEIDRDNSAYTVIVFDLNHLKMVNDTRGHEEGDRYIRAFGQILHEVFGGYGETGRTGGDEFVVILKDSNFEKLSDLISEMNEKIEEINMTNEYWNMSTAYGYCTSNEKEFDNIRKAYKEADARMYANKIRMKNK